MKLINYKRGYNNEFDCSIHGTIKMTQKEFEQAYQYLQDNADAGYPYFNGLMLKADAKRRVFTKEGYLINIRVTATEMLANKYNLTNYKRGNYQIAVKI